MSCSQLPKDVNGHNHARPDADALSRPLVLALAITSTFALVEFVGGLLSGSLALLSDAGHMFTDSLAIALSLVAIRIAMRAPTQTRTFGFLRAEILAALVNGVTLVVISLLIFYEASRRIRDPPEVEAPLMLAVALAGLGANAAGVYLLHDTSRSSLNVRGAFLHMLGDLMSSLAVIAGALAIYFWELYVADPALSIIIGAIIAFGAWKLVTQSTSILLESVPEHVRLDDVRDGLLFIEGVEDVHDLHVWTLSSGLYAMSAHLVIGDRMLSGCSDVVRACEGMLRERFSISHTTFQLECETCGEASCAFNAVNTGGPGR